jgi:hypothetical protein
MHPVAESSLARSAMDERVLKRRLRAALAMLFARDGRLLEYAAGERAVAAKLAAYLALLFRHYDVDVEYNRQDLDPKTLDLPAPCRGGGRRRVYPDVIVHRRGHDRANLLVVELKKETNREPRTRDRAKIAAMKRKFGYKWGVSIELPATS